MAAVMYDIPAIRAAYPIRFALKACSAEVSCMLHLLVMAMAFSGGVTSTLLASDIRPASDAPPPLSPEESQKLFQVPSGFRVELVASEPHLADPVAMAFDAQGRILVCEIHGYNLEGYYDILELNKTGVLDQQVRRILANEEAIKKAQQEQYGTVKRLEDVDGDGRIDRSTVLADRLPPCYGLVPARDGVIVFCAPDIIYLADKDDDGKAECRETLFSGFGVGEMWTRINNPRWGVDNWIYGVSGQGSGGTIRGPHLDGNVVLPSVCFQFKADGSALQAASGTTHGYGQAIDQWGNRFLVTNQQHVLQVLPIPNRYLARNPYYAAPNLTQNICSYGHPAGVYPTSHPDPWRRARAADPAWVRFYGEAEATANGYFTAASGPVIYTDRRYPTEYWGNHFSVDNAQNLIHRCKLTPDGIGFLATRPQDNERSEFLTSTEQWFRPVNMVTGPDGMLYVVDMYRDIIEDYSAIPRYLQQLYVRSLIAGAERGRIWRIAYGDGGARDSSDLSGLSSEALVNCLNHSNSWRRLTAQRLLVERQDRGCAQKLKDLAAHATEPQTRLHALYTLSGLELLDPSLVRDRLLDPDAHVRVHALRLAEPWLESDADERAAALALERDAEPIVRLQVALSLGECSSSQAVEALARMAIANRDDSWLQAAIVSSSMRTAAPLLKEVLSAASAESIPHRLVHDLAFVVGAHRDFEQIADVLSALDVPVQDGRRERQLAVLTGMNEALDRGSPASGSAALAARLRPFILSEQEEVRRLALKMAHNLRIEQLPEMRSIFQSARQTALDPSVSLTERQQALATIAAAPFGELEPVVRELLSPRHPIDLQIAAVHAVDNVRDAGVTRLLLEDFAQYTPALSQAVVDALFARQQRLPALLGAIENGHPVRTALDAVRREQLLQNRDPGIRETARRLFTDTAASAGRQEVLARYQQALQLPRDLDRGKGVFDKQCSKCHKLAGFGYEVGPDLANAQTRTDETLISDILNPSDQITVGYSSYTVTTQEGRIHAGVLATETATSITLRAEESRETTILRYDIDEMYVSAISMMPENLESEVTPQDVADLLAYLRQSLGSNQASAIILFDEDPRFADWLSEGEGRAVIERVDCARGAAALRISPPQRFATSIPGWDYCITENPGPGEFRYLRFAWKQDAGDGSMIELASSGRWPDADDSRFRYYSGRNTTAWNALRLAAEPPREWTVVTRDLWRDFGAFTLTGIAPTAMGGDVLLDRVELRRTP